MERTCKSCGQAYGGHVAFCFADGTPLGDTPHEPTPPPVSRRAPPSAAAYPTLAPEERLWIPGHVDPEPTPTPAVLAARPPMAAPDPRVWWVTAFAVVFLAVWLLA